MLRMRLLCGPWRDVTGPAAGRRSVRSAEPLRTLCSETFLEKLGALFGDGGHCAPRTLSITFREQAGRGQPGKAAALSGWSLCRVFRPRPIPAGGSEAVTLAGPGGPGARRPPAVFLLRRGLWRRALSRDAWGSQPVGSWEWERTPPAALGRGRADPPRPLSAPSSSGTRPRPARQCPGSRHRPVSGAGRGPLHSRRWPLAQKRSSGRAVR